MKYTLRELRLNKMKMSTIKEFSDFVGMSYINYYRKENNMRKLTACELITICKKCKVKAEEIQL